MTVNMQTHLGTQDLFCRISDGLVSLSYSPMVSIHGLAWTACLTAWGGIHGVAYLKTHVKIQIYIGRLHGYLIFICKNIPDKVRLLSFLLPPLPVYYGPRG